MSSNEIRRSVGGQHYVDLVFVARDPLTGDEVADVLAGLDVEISVRAAGATEDTWLPAAWVGTPTSTGLARTLSKFTFAAGRFEVRGRTDADEIYPDGYTFVVTA